MKIEAMLWILVLVSVAIAIVSTKHRAYSLIAAGGIILTIVAIVVLTDQRKLPPSPLQKTAPAALAPSKRVDFEKFHIENLDKEDPEAKNRIPIKEIRFEQIRSQVGSQAGSIDSIRARLYNDSTRFALTDYAYYLVVQDCVKTTCTTIYDQRGQTAVSVPANQARDIVIVIRDDDTRGIPHFKVLGTASIALSATETRAYLASP